MTPFLTLALFIETVIFYSIFVTISKVKFHKAETLIIILVSYLLFVLTALITPMPDIIGLKANIIFILIITFATNRKIKILSLSALYGILSSIVLLTSGYALGAVFRHIFEHVSRDIVMNSWILYFLYTGISAGIALCIARLAGNFLHKKLFLFDDSTKRKLATYILVGAVITLILFFIITFLQYIIIDIAIRGVLYAITLIVFFIFLVFAIFTFADNFHKKTEISHKDELLKNLQAYTNSVENMATEVRKFKHDHLNLMLGFNEYIVNNDIDKIREYFHEYISAFQKNTSIADSRLDVLKNLNIPELKSILSFKILYAQQKNIDVSIEIPDVIDEVDAHMLIDICRIAGVLIDNAIEASEDAEKAVLRFLALKKEERIIFVFTNTYTEVPSLSKIFENGFTTKQGARGLGLYSVSQMIEANERLSLNTHIEDTFFVQELSVFL